MNNVCLSKKEKENKNNNSPYASIYLFGVCFFFSLQDKTVFSSGYDWLIQHRESREASDVGFTFSPPLWSAQLLSLTSIWLQHTFFQQLSTEASGGTVCASCTLCIKTFLLCSGRLKVSSVLFKWHAASPGSSFLSPISFPSFPPPPPHYFWRQLEARG